VTVFGSGQPEQAALCPPLPIPLKKKGLPFYFIEAHTLFSRLALFPALFVNQAKQNKKAQPHRIWSLHFKLV